MHTPRSSIRIAALACALAMAAAPAEARPSQTWVSASGTNAGDCSESAPCATLQFALRRTGANGTITILTAGDYGPMVIDRAIRVVAKDVEALITAGFNGYAVTVDAPSDAVVSLYGLTIDMQGTSNAGILFNSGAALHVYQSTIRRAAQGVEFKPGSGTSRLHIADSVISDTTGGAGITIQPSGSALAIALLDRVRVLNGAGNGMFFDGTGTSGTVAVAIRDCTAGHNATNGIEVTEASTDVTAVMIDRSILVGNDKGLKVTGSGAAALIGRSTVSANISKGIAPSSGGAIASYGDNQVNGNSNDGLPTVTIGRI